MLSATAKNKNLQFFYFLGYIVMWFVSTKYMFIFCIFYFKAVVKILKTLICSELLILSAYLDPQEESDAKTSDQKILRYYPF